MAFSSHHTEELNLHQLQNALQKHFSSVSLRQKTFRRYEKKSFDGQIEAMRRKIEPEVASMIRRTQSEPMVGMGGGKALNKLLIPPRGGRKRAQPVERVVQVGIARPTVPEDFGTSDLYANWRPGRGESAGALVAVPLVRTQAKQLGGLTLDDERLVELANEFSLRSSMERVEMDDDVCDSVDAIVVDRERYEERMKTENYGPVELFPPKRVSVKDLGETLDSTGLRSSMFRGRASTRQPQASTVDGFQALTADREVSLRSGSLDSSLTRSNKLFADSIDSKFRLYGRR